MCSYTFPRQHVREIGLRLSVLGGFPGFGIRITLECFHFGGTVSLSHNSSFKYFVEAAIWLSPMLWSILCVMPSSPGERFFFMDVTAGKTSSRVISLSNISFGAPLYSLLYDKFACSAAPCFRLRVSRSSASCPGKVCDFTEVVTCTSLRGGWVRHASD